jgi:hypothetical protein
MDNVRSCDSYINIQSSQNLEVEIIAVNNISLIIKKSFSSNKVILYLYANETFSAIRKFISCSHEQHSRLWHSGGTGLSRCAVYREVTPRASSNNYPGGMCTQAHRDHERLNGATRQRQLETIAARKVRGKEGNKTGDVMGQRNGADKGRDDGETKEWD